MNVRDVLLLPRKQFLFDLLSDGDHLDIGFGLLNSPHDIPMLSVRGSYDTLNSAVIHYVREPIAAEYFFLSPSILVEEHIAKL